MCRQLQHDGPRPHVEEVDAVLAGRADHPRSGPQHLLRYRDDIHSPNPGRLKPAVASRYPQPSRSAVGGRW